MPDALERGLSRYFSPQQLFKLANARVGIAGAGGLGSNTAMLLARSGIQHMLICDFDIVDESNLNRQQFWPEHIGQAKTSALGAQLRRLTPRISLDLRQIRLDEENLPQIVPLADIWVEALDIAASKKLLAEYALMAGKFVTAASGIAGYGGPPMRARQVGNLFIAGDFETDISVAPPLAPRVAQAAALMADGVLHHILG